MNGNLFFSSASRMKTARGTLPGGSESISPAESSFNKGVKTKAYYKIINRARGRLSPVEKVISRAIHQPIVDEVSDLASKTVGHSWGILGAGLLGLSGTFTYSVAGLYYGYSYNSSILLLFLGGGFILGVLMKVLFNLLRGSSP